MQGRAEALPFADASFDVVTMGYALRHMADFGSVFAEFRRVLKPGGTLLILEIARAENRVVQAIAMAWLGRAIPAICGSMMPRRQARLLMRYYWDTIRECAGRHHRGGVGGCAGFAGAARRRWVCSANTGRAPGRVGPYRDRPAGPCHDLPLWTALRLCGLLYAWARAVSPKVKTVKRL